MFYRDFYKLILNFTDINEWKSTILVNKEWYSITKELILEYFTSIVPHPIFLPKQLTFSRIITEDIDILVPFYNYNCVIRDQSFRKNIGGGAKKKFYFDFGYIRVLYEFCKNGYNPEYVKLPKVTTKKKVPLISSYSYVSIEMDYEDVQKINPFEINRNCYSNYLTINIDGDKFLITSCDNNNYFIPPKYLRYKKFENVSQWLAMYENKYVSDAINVMRILEKLLTY